MALCILSETVTSISHVRAIRYACDGGRERGLSPYRKIGGVEISLKFHAGQVDDPYRPLLPFEHSLVTERLKRAVHVHCGKPCGIAELLLAEGKFKAILRCEPRRTLAGVMSASDIASRSRCKRGLHRQGCHAAVPPYLRHLAVSPCCLDERSELVTFPPLPVAQQVRPPGKLGHGVPDWHCLPDSKLTTSTPVRS